MRTNVVDLAHDAEEIVARLGVDKDGRPFAEIRPVTPPTHRLNSPERQALIKSLFPEPMMDSGRILEEDR
jgi:hypothetical protein